MPMTVEAQAMAKTFKRKVPSYLKTQQTLDFGTEKVIWIFTATQKVMVATRGADWTISDWSKTIEVLDGVVFNLAEFVEKEGISLDQPESNL